MSQYNQTRSYNVGIAQEVGIDGALIFGYLSFWWGKRRDDEIYQSNKEIMEWFPHMSERTSRRAISKLIAAGYVSKKVKKANGNPTNHFKVLRFGQFDHNEMDNLTTSIHTVEENIRDTPNPDIQRIYEYYLIRRYKIQGPDDLDKYKSRMKLTPKRRALIVRRLGTDGVTYENAKRAIDNMMADKFITGQEPGGKFYATIEYAFRSYEKMEEWWEKDPQKNNNDWSNL